MPVNIQEKERVKIGTWILVIIVYQKEYSRVSSFFYHHLLSHFTLIILCHKVSMVLLLDKPTFAWMTCCGWTKPRANSARMQLCWSSLSSSRTGRGGVYEAISPVSSPASSFFYPSNAPMRIPVHFPTTSEVLGYDKSMRIDSSTHTHSLSILNTSLWVIHNVEVRLAAWGCGRAFSVSRVQYWVHLRHICQPRSSPVYAPCFTPRKPISVNLFCWREARKWSN